jgi:hypothetical protein
MSVNLTKNCKNLMLISATIIAVSVIFFGAGIISSMIYAQPSEKIIVSLNSTKLTPSANGTHTQLKAVVGYVTKDASLLNSKINGIMKVSLLNGTVLKRSSSANGFIVNQSGTISFATSLVGKTMQNAKIDIVLTDPSKTLPLSNIVTSNVNLDTTSIPSGSNKAPLSANPLAPTTKAPLSANPLAPTTKAPLSANPLAPIKPIP